MKSGTVTIEANVKETVVSYKIRNVVMVEHVDTESGKNEYFRHCRLRKLTG